MTHCRCETLCLCGHLVSFTLFDATKLLVDFLGLVCDVDANDRLAKVALMLDFEPAESHLHVPTSLQRLIIFSTL